MRALDIVERCRGARRSFAQAFAERRIELQGVAGGNPINARSMAFSSSRTLPGQSWRASALITSSGTLAMRRPRSR